MHSSFHLFFFYKEPRFWGGAPRHQTSEIEISPPAYLGAVESLLVDFFEDFLWCDFLWLLLDLAGADAEVSAGGVVSAASTGPAASVSRHTTGTSFLNIDRLHCREKSLSGWEYLRFRTPASKRPYYDWNVSLLFQDDCNVMLGLVRSD